MKPSTKLGLVGIGLVTAGSLLAAYTFLVDEDTKKRTKSSLDELLEAASNVAGRVRDNAEDTARKAQRVAEDNIKWTQDQWDRLRAQL